MELQDLNPPRAVIHVGDIEVELKPFSLFEKAWVLQEFSTPENKNGLQVLADALGNLDMLTVSRFAWRLVADKNSITKKEFFSHCEDRKNLVKVYEALCKCLKDSEPTKHASRKLEELKKS